jgi:hypothetical protein
MSAYRRTDESTREKLSNLLTSLSKTVLIAVVLDVIAQYLLFGQVRITSAIMITIIILVVPYSAAMAGTNRIVTKRRLIRPGSNEHCQNDHL